mmetsp:Transcript_49680/g.120427  ORF Transcript_49680/g.120427 Transcript_49680/m.120427 type:complete len:386 (-) Transcript_49680:56-1213(-)
MSLWIDCNPRRREVQPENTRHYDRSTKPRSTWTLFQGHKTEAGLLLVAYTHTELPVLEDSLLAMSGFGGGFGSGGGFGTSPPVGGSGFGTSSSNNNNNSSFGFGANAGTNVPFNQQPPSQQASFPFGSAPTAPPSIPPPGSSFGASQSFGQAQAPPQEPAGTLFGGGSAGHNSTGAVSFGSSPNVVMNNNNVVSTNSTFGGGSGSTFGTNAGFGGAGTSTTGFGGFGQASSTTTSSFASPFGQVPTTAPTLLQPPLARTNNSIDPFGSQQPSTSTSSTSALQFGSSSNVVTSSVMGGGGNASRGFGSASSGGFGVAAPSASSGGCFLIPTFPLFSQGFTSSLFDSNEAVRKTDISEHITYPLKVKQDDKNTKDNYYIIYGHSFVL